MGNRKEKRVTGVGRAATVVASTLLTVLPPAVVTAITPAGTAYGAQRPRSASIARTLSVTDSAHLHYIHSSGSALIEQGSATGELPGNMHVDLNVGATFTGTFTIYASGGTITGRGTATPHGSGRFESFSGSLVVTGGTGRYAHAHGKAGLYGSFDRKTYALAVQTTGKLSY